MKLRFSVSSPESGLADPPPIPRVQAPARTEPFAGNSLCGEISLRYSYYLVKQKAQQRFWPGNDTVKMEEGNQ